MTDGLGHPYNGTLVFTPADTWGARASPLATPGGMIEIPDRVPVENGHATLVLPALLPGLLNWTAHAPGGGSTRYNFGLSPLVIRGPSATVAPAEVSTSAPGNVAVTLMDAEGKPWDAACVFLEGPALPGEGHRTAGVIATGGVATFSLAHVDLGEARVYAGSNPSCWDALALRGPNGDPIVARLAASLPSPPGTPEGPASSGSVATSEEAGWGPGAGVIVGVLVVGAAAAAVVLLYNRRPG